MTFLEREIYDQFLQLQRQKKLDSKYNQAELLEFLKKCSWDTCVITIDQNKRTDHFLVEYNDVFAEHRFGRGYNTELKIKLTPENPLPVFFKVHRLQSTYALKLWLNLN